MGRLLLISAVLAAIVFSVFPGIDLWASGLFYDPGRGFHLKDAWWAVTLYDSIPVIAMLVGGGALLLLIRSVVGRKPSRRLPNRFLLFVIVALAVGPGLVVNLGFKDHWGRARPRDVAEFAGERQFTPALVPTDQCRRNCSFVAGHPSVMFWLAAMAYASTEPRKRRRILVAAVALGLLAGLGRIVQGGHFLSDVLFSGIVTTTVVWALAARVFKLDPATPAGPVREGSARSV